MSAQLDHRLAREYFKFEGKDLLWQEAFVKLIGSADIFASSQRSARSHASAGPKDAALRDDLAAASVPYHYCQLNR
jgi:hypothetical protein